MLLNTFLEFTPTSSFAPVVSFVIPMFEFIPVMDYENEL